MFWRFPPEIPNDLGREYTQRWELREERISLSYHMSLRQKTLEEKLSFMQLRCDSIRGKHCSEGWFVLLRKKKEEELTRELVEIQSNPFMFCKEMAPCPQEWCTAQNGSDEFKWGLALAARVDKQVRRSLSHHHYFIPKHVHCHHSDESAPSSVTLEDVNIQRKTVNQQE